MSYCKISSSILASTIWLESIETKVLWITILVMKDQYGEVRASIPGLARMAGISVEGCREGLQILMSPDPDSSTKDDNGARLKPIEGGWLVINHEKHIKITSLEQKREKDAIRQQRKRDTDKA